MGVMDGRDYFARFEFQMSFGLILYPVWSLDSDGVRDDTPSPGVYLKKYERNSRFVVISLLWFVGLRRGSLLVHFLKYPSGVVVTKAP